MDFPNRDILQKVISGDESSFEQVYYFYYPKLSYFAKQYILDSEITKNILQDVFTELWDRKASLKKDTNLNAWLFTVTKNKSLKVISQLNSQRNYNNYLKVRQLDVNYKSLSDFDTSNFVFGELQKQVQTSLDRLSPACRRIFEMSRFEDKKNREIAEELNLSIKTVEAQISKALRTLKSDLKEYLLLIYVFFLLHK